jgi:peptide/nickel transport system substrate-binding protein
MPQGNAWFNAALKPHTYDTGLARRTLAQGGFRFRADGRLIDAKGNAVEFSIVTNAGNKVRAQMASLIQQDLRRIGIEVNIVPLDFPSLIERITKSMNYEACLLGLVNVDPDPNGQMNVWLSSGASHTWNPAQKSPATPWEQEIDTLMRRQAAAPDFKTRKQAFDKVQQIASVEVPLIFLTHRNALTAVASALAHVRPVPLRPHLYWDVEHIRLQGGANARASASR